MKLNVWVDIKQIFFEKSFPFGKKGILRHSLSILFLIALLVSFLSILRGEFSLFVRPSEEEEGMIHFPPPVRPFNFAIPNRRPETISLVSRVPGCTNYIMVFFFKGKNRGLWVTFDPSKRTFWSISELTLISLSGAANNSPYKTSNNFYFCTKPVVRLLRQRWLWHHLFARLRWRPRQKEEQEEAEERAAAHEPAQQRGGEEGERNIFCCCFSKKGNFIV